MALLTVILNSPLQATPKDAEQIFRAIEHRIQTLKHVELMKAESGEAESTSKPEDDDEEEEEDQEERRNDEMDAASRDASGPDETAVTGEQVSSSLSGKMGEDAGKGTTTTTTSSTLQGDDHTGTSTEKGECGICENEMSPFQGS